MKSATGPKSKLSTHHSSLITSASRRHRALGADDRGHRGAARAHALAVEPLGGKPNFRTDGDLVVERDDRRVLGYWPFAGPALDPAGRGRPDERVDDRADGRRQFPARRAAHLHADVVALLLLDRHHRHLRDDL